MSKSTKKAKAPPTSTTVLTVHSAPALAPSASTERQQFSTVTLELISPQAKKVYVAGSFNDWKPDKTPLMRTSNDRWIGDLTIKPGKHEYLFVVDGHWLPDPKAMESVPNPFGGWNSVLSVSG